MAGNKITYSRRQELLLIGFAVFFWFATAISAYLTVWLQEEGFSSSQLGVINAVASGVGILVITLTGVISDRIGSLVKTLILCLIIGFGAYSLIPFLPCHAMAFTVFVLVLSAMSLFRNPMTSLAENLLVRNCNELSLNYGRIRSSASLAYCLGGLAATGVIAWIGTGGTFWLGGLLGIPAIVFAFFIRDPDGIQDHTEANFRRDTMALIQSRPYLILIFSVFVYQMGHVCRLNFLPYYMQGIGLDPGKYGVLLAYSAILEIPSLMVLSLARKRFDYRQLLIIAVVLQLTEVVLMGTVCSSLPALLLITTLYGLGNGLYLAAVLNYVYVLAPMSLRASAQAFYQAFASIACIIGNLIGGVAFEQMGAKSFYLSLGILYILSATLLVCNKSQERPLTAETP